MSDFAHCCRLTVLLRRPGLAPDATERLLRELEQKEWRLSSGERSLRLGLLADLLQPGEAVPPARDGRKAWEWDEAVLGLGLRLKDGVVGPGDALDWLRRPAPRGAGYGGERERLRSPCWELLGVPEAAAWFGGRCR